ncbi:MAG: CbtA family protein [Nitrososphaeraceae archaeon]
MEKNSLKAIAFVIITLLSGAIAGTILGIINQALVEPYIDRAISIETQNAIKEGEIVDSVELQNYRIWQKGGEIVAGTILGMSFGALFGIVFVYCRSLLLPQSDSNIRKALVLAGIMWFVLFLIPALKYPANPPAVGDPETIYYRESLYIGFLAISGFSALGLALLYRKIRSLAPNNKNRLIVVPLIYAAIIVGAFLILPPNPDKISVPMDLVQGFRITSAFTMSIFWGLLGLILGAFWNRLQPHETTRITTV